MLLQQHKVANGHFDYLAYLFVKFRKSFIKELQQNSEEISGFHIKKSYKKFHIKKSI